MDKKQEWIEVRGLLGEYLQRERKNRDISQEQLAELCELSANHISKIERGCISVKFESLMRICIALGISVDRFIIQYVEANRPENEEYLRALRNARDEEERERLKERLNIAVDDMYKAK